MTVFDEIGRISDEPEPVRLSGAAARWPTAAVGKQSPVSGRSAVDRFSDRLTELFPDVMKAVGDSLAGMWPAYADYLQLHNPDIMLAAELIVPHLVHGLRRDGQEQGLALSPSVAGMFEQLGRNHYVERKDLVSLLTAFQSGSQAAWRVVSAAGLESGLRPEEMGALAETLFAVVHDISVHTAHGFVAEQSDSGMAAERARSELAVQLMAPFVDTRVVQSWAARAAWPMPDLAAFVVLHSDEDTEPPARITTDPEWLYVRTEGVVGLIVPWTNRSRARLQRLLSSAVVGPPTPLTELRRSLIIAHNVSTLKRAGLLSDAVTFADEHLDTLLVHWQPRLLVALREQALEPLAGLPEGTRERLVETLTSWLRHLGSRLAVAEDLHIHPQTVRYRLDQLREVFGDTLDDADGRAKLFLALNWGQPLTDPGGAPPELSR